MPLNQSINYLTNAREIALLAVKEENLHLIQNMIKEFIIIQ